MCTYFSNIVSTTTMEQIFSALNIDKTMFHSKSKMVFLNNSLILYIKREFVGKLNT